MHYETVKDVVDHSRQLHQQISQFYHKLSEKNAQARVSMLLEFLQRHEANLADTLNKFEKDKSQKVLDSWLQFSPDQDLNQELAEMEVNENMDADDVVEVALKLDKYFIDLYQDMVDGATSSAVKEVFQNLLDMEEHERIQTAKAALQINDM